MLAETALRTPPPGSPLWLASGPNSPSPQQLAEAAAGLAVAIAVQQHAARAAMQQKGPARAAAAEIACPLGGVNLGRESKLGVAAEGADDVLAKRLDQGSSGCGGGCPTQPPPIVPCRQQQLHQQKCDQAALAGTTAAAMPPGQGLEGGLGMSGTAPSSTSVSAPTSAATAEMDQVRDDANEERRLLQQLQAQRRDEEVVVQRLQAQRQVEEDRVRQLQGMHGGSTDGAGEEAGDRGCCMPPPSPVMSVEGSLVQGSRVRRRGKRHAAASATSGTEDGGGGDGDRLPLAALPANTTGSNALCIVGGMVTEPSSPAACESVSCQTDASEACFMCASSRALADGLRKELGRLQLLNAKVWGNI